MIMWYNEISNDSDVVLSTRIRYARNIEKQKFPHVMNSSELENIVRIAENSIDKAKYQLLKSSHMDDMIKGSLVERHLISKEFLQNPYAAMITNDDYKLIAMINEEDHFRIQSFESGLHIEKCYENLKRFTESLEKKITFAKNQNYGYLTSCPTSLGSGMRVSVMLHLPGLAKLKLLGALLEQALSIGLSVRGIYGENTNSYGYMYQISNRKTLGVSDEEIMYNMKAVVNTIIEQERSAREILLKNNKIEVEDEVWRAYGILKNARTLTEEEAIQLLSKLRFGVSIKMIQDISLEKIQVLMNDTHSCTLKIILKTKLSSEEESIRRADYVRKELES